MVTRRKPDPEPYLRAAQLWGLPPAIVWSSGTLPQASVPERPPAVPCWVILAAPSRQGRLLRQISLFLIFIFTDKFHFFRIFLRSDFMTKQTKPVQIGFGLFDLAAPLRAGDPPPPRNGSTYFFSEGSMAFRSSRHFLPARCSPARLRFPQHPCSPDPRTQRLRTLTPSKMRTAQRLPG